MIDLRSTRQLAGELLGAVLTRLAPAGTADPCPRRPDCPPWCPCRIDTDLDPEPAVWRVGDLAPGCVHSHLGELDPLVGATRCGCVEPERDHAAGLCWRTPLAGQRGNTLDESVQVHPFEPEWSAASPYCGALVMRDGGGDTCGELAAAPVHEVLA